MNRFLKNWRTTLFGIGAILAAISDIITQVSTRDWDTTRLAADVTGLFTGVGLIFARDAVVSEKEHEQDQRRIAQHGREIDHLAAKVT